MPKSIEYGMRKPSGTGFDRRGSACNPGPKSMKPKRGSSGKAATQKKKHKSSGKGQ